MIPASAPLRIARPTRDLATIERFYLGERPEPAWLDRIREHGGAVVPARNPYWDQWGVTVQDPDGYLLVLSHRSWE